MSGPLSIPCTACKNTDLPWWQVGLLTLVGCLIAYGLLWGVSRLLPGSRTRRAATRDRTPGTDHRPDQRPDADPRSTSS